MASGIEQNDTGIAVGQDTWHGKFQVLSEAPTLQEGIKLAGLDWPVYTGNILDSNGNMIEGSKQTYRMLGDERIHLGIVGDNYRPLQNDQAFSFFDPFVANGMVKINTAGSLFNGKRIFVNCEIQNDNLSILPGDEIKSYVLLSNSHDGTLAVRVGFTPIRVVCNNTLTMAHHSEASKLIKVKHRKNMIITLESLRETMDLVNQQFIATAEQYRHLTTLPCNQEDLEKYVKQVFSLKGLEAGLDDVVDLPSINKDGSERKQKVLVPIQELFEAGRGSDIPGVKGTMWGAYNAISEYVQYDRGNIKTTEDDRFSSINFGTGAKIVERALAVASNW